MYPTIESTVNEILTEPWNITDGRVVPETENIVMKNGGKKVDATYIYADLAESSGLAQNLTKEAAAKIIRAYINTSARILRQYGGEIRSFDGDRVMAIFMGEEKNWKAVRAALAINWAVLEVIRPAIRTAWTDGADFSEINHGIGIDTGEALIVRGGVRDNNDLISVGAAPNVAAKLSDIRDSFPIHITDRVRVDLNEELLTYNEGRNQIWQKLSGQTVVGGKYHTVYGSSVQWGL
ncbi:adenylate/guanylate cyclase domain-containing protein [Microbacterium lacus]|uniref:adenylate/guanylate cyclase domain-containing protein n=1 Tax=Microbacterium lacus TaxID=415217 RepID=UPI003850E33B